jgi:two-component system, OmpR family, response regulator
MKILVVEDDRVIADFVGRGLREAGYLVDQTDNGLDALGMVTGNVYDLAVVDIMLPGMDGITLIQQARTRKLQLPIIVLSAKGNVDDRIRGLRSGSDDYMAKPFSISELLARVETLLRRANHAIESTEITVSDLSLDLIARTVKRGGRRIDLQPKEFSLLEYLIRNAGRVVSKTMIMERVWDYHFDPRTNVVEARVSKLREKIDKNHDIKLIHTVRGLGYVLRQPD